MAPVVPQPFALHMLDVGQGEAILMDLPDGSFGLLDAGPRKDASGVFEEVARRCDRGHVFRFAGASQWDRDHIAGLPKILRAYPPIDFVMPGVDVRLLEELCAAKDQQEGRKLASEVWSICKSSSSMGVVPLHAPQQLPDLGGVEAFALSPNAKIAADIEAEFRPDLNADDLKRYRNRTSLVLWIRVYGRTLLAGEAEPDQFREMDAQFRKRRGGLRDYWPPAADWIKLSHHGSQHNNGDTLFRLFTKAKFVASASAGGRYAHPHPVTLRSLKQMGGAALCTRLGQGCSLIIDSGLDPLKSDEWASSHDLVRIPNPRKKCYGKITVEVDALGGCRILTTSVRTDCPYDGPTSTPIAL